MITNVEEVRGSHADNFLGYNAANRLDGSDGDDILNGRGGNDDLIGGNGHDTVWGGDGQDLMHGGARDDTIHGGLGNDVMTGGLGADVFVFNAGNGSDRITDFGAADAIRFVGIAGLNFGNLNINYTGGNAVVDYGSGSITLNGIAPNSLSAGDFEFIL